MPLPPDSDPGAPDARLPDPARPLLRARRSFLRALGLGALAAPLALREAAAQAVVPEAGTAPPLPQADLPLPAAARTPGLLTPAVFAPPQPLLRPPRLRRGDTIGLVCPASYVEGPRLVADARAELEALGFRTKVGRHVLESYGYLAGTDQQRADDLMAMFRDDEVKAVLALRGGWGCARLLPLLDYDAIRANPKALIGYSDITALLLAVYVRAGLVTFHGPVGRSTWNRRTVDAFRRVLMDGEHLTLDPAAEALGADGEMAGRSRQQAYQPIRAGVAAGPLVGGNLSVVAGLVGTPYLPDFAGHVVFFEEVGESLYRVDRLLTQLRLAGAFDEMAGLVFGQCSRCSSDGAPGLPWLLRDQLAGLRAAAWTGAPIGHVSPVYTLPIGTRVATDAALGTLRMLEPAVV